MPIKVHLDDIPLCWLVHCDMLNLSGFYQLWYPRSISIEYIEFPLYMYLDYKTCINSTRLSNCTQNCLQWNQTLTRPSSPADAIHFPSGLNLTQLTPFLWPCGWRVNLDSSLRHQLTCNTHTMYHKYHVVKQKFILTLYV